MSAPWPQGAASEFYPAYINECVLPYQTKIDAGYSAGLKPPQLIMDAGLKTDFVAADQPIFRDGPGKHLWEETWTFACNAQCRKAW